MSETQAVLEQLAADVLLREWAVRWAVIVGAGVLSWLVLRTQLVHAPHWRLRVHRAGALVGLFTSLFAFALVPDTWRIEAGSERALHETRCALHDASWSAQGDRVRCENGRTLSLRWLAAEPLGVPEGFALEGFVPTSTAPGEPGRTQGTMRVAYLPGSDLAVAQLMPR